MSLFKITYNQMKKKEIKQKYRKNIYKIFLLKIIKKILKKNITQNVNILTKKNNNNKLKN